jgi:AcrR family transcriptional regulator
MKYDISYGIIYSRMKIFVKVYTEVLLRWGMTMKQHEDRRMRRTQQALADAMIALTLEKGYDAVTIRDITEHADVGYTTFFRHYRDKDDLLHDVLAVVFAEFIEHLESQSSTTTEPIKKGILIFRYVQEHAEIIRVLFDSKTIRNELMTLATQKVICHNQSFHHDIIPIEVLAHNFIVSTLGLIEWWLENKMPYSPEQMGLIHDILVINPIHQLKQGCSCPQVE